MNKTEQNLTNLIESKNISGNNVDLTNNEEIDNKN